MSMERYNKTSCNSIKSIMKQQSTKQIRQGTRLTISRRFRLSNNNRHYLIKLCLTAVSISNSLEAFRTIRSLIQHLYNRVTQVKLKMAFNLLTLSNTQASTVKTTNIILELTTRALTHSTKSRILSQISQRSTLQTTCREVD